MCDGDALSCCMHAGSFSFPNVPPNAELDYDLELIDFEGVDEVCKIYCCSYHQASVAPVQLPCRAAQ